ncbi:site-specific integrase [Synechococcus sp. ATX 2A4]|uniref:site-specific integrase n=1 Tax=Synechococcus sp. ATX 2A4 TaxID=2823727 RepID=UPI0020CF73E7|nr:site-specific integrase [Synechococcus sp. ATX 2A4]MCP9885872.1 site-specific integrase [Synechococcus sp. ATX 2A4]
MPVLIAKSGHPVPPWVLGLRQTVSSNPGRKSWLLTEHRGTTKLQIRVGTTRPSVKLPLDWCQANVPEIVRLCDAIAFHLENGSSLANAVKASMKGTARAGEAGALAHHAGVAGDWRAASERFKTQKLLHGNAIKAPTWRLTYEPVISDALSLLQSPNPPRTSADLIDLTVRAWAPGSRTRQIRARNLAQFLNHCVTREGFPLFWSPPADLAPHIGRKPAGTRSGGGDPFTDQQILNLLAGIPDDAVGHRWLDALRLLAELGLRPVELGHLSVRSDPATGEAHWWCSYEKASGGGVTKARRIHPLPLVDHTGALVEWQLLRRWQQGLIELPPLESGNGAGDALATYLKRRAAWRNLRQELACKGEVAVPYSFRHSYSLRAHHRGIDPGAVSQSMGHSLECHLRSYAWCSEGTTAAAFNRADLALRRRCSSQLSLVSNLVTQDVA